MSKRAIVFGAYGFIGAASCRKLQALGYTVVGVGRAKLTKDQLGLFSEWHSFDLAKTTESELANIVTGADVVVNAAGALQDGTKDDLNAIHVGFVERLIRAIGAQNTRIVQVSAAGASTDADTAFLQTKSIGDTLLLKCATNAIVLRPTLVLGPQAYGGTALMRALAAFPLVGPKVFASTPIQIVHVDEVADAIVSAAQGAGGTGIYDITSAETESFDNLVTKVRAWQGFQTWRYRVPVPQVAMTCTGIIADGLGWLGWRSPMRTTALKVLHKGVSGDASKWLEVTGQSFSGLDGCLKKIPATTQERFFARLYLFLPMTIAILGWFWMLSGLIGMARFTEAVQVLTDRDVPKGFACLAVGVGSVVDLALGMAIFVRRWCRTASLGMGLTSLVYMLGALIFAPDLWADPIGPMLKVLPVFVLSMMPFWFLEER